MLQLLKSMRNMEFYGDCNALKRLLEAASAQHDLELVQTAKNAGTYAGRQ
jgi:exo-beta-1,3-glucanase (GH17 family)